MALTEIPFKICRFHGSLSQKGSRPLVLSQVRIDREGSSVQARKQGGIQRQYDPRFFVPPQILLYTKTCFKHENKNLALPAQTLKPGYGHAAMSIGNSLWHCGVQQTSAVREQLRKKWVTQHAWRDSKNVSVRSPTGNVDWFRAGCRPASRNHGRTPQIHALWCNKRHCFSFLMK